MWMVRKMLVTMELLAPLFPRNVVTVVSHQSPRICYRDTAHPSGMPALETAQRKSLWKTFQKKKKNKKIHLPGNSLRTFTGAKELQFASQTMSRASRRVNPRSSLAERERKEDGNALNVSPILPWLDYTRTGRLQPRFWQKRGRRKRSQLENSQHPCNCAGFQNQALWRCPGRSSAL